jgi:hydroxymethylglutaryl-CoA lyase
VGTAFGCTLQGEVQETKVLRLMQSLLDAGADRLSLADTVGYADPAGVRRLLDQGRALVGAPACPSTLPLPRWPPELFLLLP